MAESSMTPDLTGIVISERTRLAIPSRPEWIPTTVELLREKARLCGACHDSRAGKLVLALHEALTNAIVHGNLEISSDLKERDDDSFARALAERASDTQYSDRPVIIEIDHEPDHCRWSILDEGKGFDFARYLRREPDEETMWLSSGRGILLMRAFVDDLFYEQGGRKVTLTLFRNSGMEKRREPRQTLLQRVQVAPIRPDGSVDWEAAYDAISQNLSPTGIGLLQAGLSTSDRVLLGVEVEGQTLYVPAQVKHCRAIDENVVELGCHFLFHKQPLPPQSGRVPTVEEAVESILTRSRHHPRTIDERREHTREAYTERIEISGIAGMDPLVGFTRDLSKGGISFITTVWLPQGPCVLTIPGREGGRVRMQARIVRCVEMIAGFYDVGVRFLAVEGQG